MFFFADNLKIKIFRESSGPFIVQLLHAVFISLLLLFRYLHSGEG